VCHGKSKINETPHFPFKMLVRCIGLDIIRGIGQEDVVRHTLQADYHDFSSSLTDSFNVHWRNNINRAEERFPTLDDYRYLEIDNTREWI
jgi:hypothetical protein